ncbi:uncharacterized protein LOC128960757 isoform X2 [Oppia nitens]|uniref:uncharacterized protein LOC128960757 isoform X2 n=1 Tax=Oppia nitens TaxID=1686743 RepID=UPI0023DB987F|nr:uncharacterized protein LOC128960757 isoform X2 [Oppia nitens]
MIKLVTLVVAVISVMLVNGVSAQNAWDQIKNAVVGTACLTTITPKLSSDCVQAFNEEVDNRKSTDKDSDNKVFCCAYLSLQSCVLKIAEKECKEEGESVAKAFLKTINRGITSDDCIDYGYITCITLTQIIIAAIISLLVIGVLSCVCCCLCRCLCGSNKRRGRVV